MDVNAIIVTDEDVVKEVQISAVENIKRVIPRADTKWTSDTAQHPYLIQDTQEVKTTWHPIGS